MSSKSGTKVDEDDLGYHAEGFFDTLCREVGIMASRPGKDKVGWDFYLVLPQLPGQIDGPPRLNCLVQVKGQWNTTQQGPPIKLSNWELMISDPTPWFVFVLLYERPKKPVRGVLVHVDEALTTQVVKRLWQNAATDNADLSDLSMRVRWEDADALPSLTGASVLHMIRDRIGDTRRYLEDKRRWKTEAGVGREKHKIYIQFREADVDYARLARAAIGDDRSDFNFPSVQVADIRFGIEIPQGLLEASKISFTPHPLREKASITFTSTNPIREEFSIQFDAYSTTVLPLPDEFRRVRLVSPLLQFEMSQGEAGTNYRWDLRIEEADVRLDHLVSAARAMRVLMDRESPPYTLDLLGKEIVIDAKSPNSYGVPEATLAMLDAAIDAGSVARSFGLALDQLTVRPWELAHQDANLRVLAELFSGSTPRSQLRITNTDSRLDGRQVGHVIVARATVGDQIFLVTVGLLGIATWKPTTDEEGDLSVVPSVRVFERKIVGVGTHAPQQLDEHIVRPMVERAEAQLERDGLAIIRVGHTETFVEMDSRDQTAELEQGTTDLARSDVTNCPDEDDDIG